MSRSHRKTYITWCNGSNKEDKRIANKRFRRRNKCSVRRLSYDECCDLLYKLREISNTYNFTTDGLAYYISKKDIKFVNDVQKLWRKIITK